MNEIINKQKTKHKQILGTSKTILSSRDGMYTIMFQPQVLVEKIITRLNRFLRIGVNKQT